MSGPYYEQNSLYGGFFFWKDGKEWGTEEEWRPKQNVWHTVFRFSHGRPTQTTVTMRVNRGITMPDKKYWHKVRFICLLKWWILHSQYTYRRFQVQTQGQSTVAHFAHDVSWRGLPYSCIFLKTSNILASMFPFAHINCILISVYVLAHVEVELVYSNCVSYRCCFDPAIAPQWLMAAFKKLRQQIATCSYFFQI